MKSQLLRTKTCYNKIIFFFSPTPPLPPRINKTCQFFLFLLHYISLFLFFYVECKLDSRVDVQLTWPTGFRPGFSLHACAVCLGWREQLSVCHSVVCTLQDKTRKKIYSRYAEKQKKIMIPRSEHINGIAHQFWIYNIFVVSQRKKHFFMRGPSR